MVEKLKVNVEVTKEAYELAQGINKFVGAVRASLADGWQTGQDVPAIVTAAIGSLVPSIQGIEKIKDEAKKEHLEEFVAAFAIPAKEMAFSFIDKTPTN